MKIATWNVNGIRARQYRLLAWLEARRPDVLCLQEIKIEDDKFPAEPLRALGYEVVTHGQRAWNGVAIASRAPLTDVARGLSDGLEDPQARLLAATIEGVRVHCCYVPNGEAVGSEKFGYKLSWLTRFRTHLEGQLRADAPAIVCGDFNIAPADLDVHDPAAWAGQCLFTLEERGHLERVLACGLTDLLRVTHPTSQIFTYWDYRMLSFPKNHGLRIDHVLGTPPVVARLDKVWVDREARKGKLPSDHAPVIAELR